MPAGRAAPARPLEYTSSPTSYGGARGDICAARGPSQGPGRWRRHTSPAVPNRTPKDEPGSVIGLHDRACSIRRRRRCRRGRRLPRPACRRRHPDDVPRSISKVSSKLEAGRTRPRRGPRGGSGRTGGAAALSSSWSWCSALSFCSACSPERAELAAELLVLLDRPSRSSPLRRRGRRPGAGRQRENSLDGRYDVPGGVADRTDGVARLASVVERDRRDRERERG